MFKIESYVTPILLSYVDKYVRDFKPADAQVSLWGGGVALHNLVLKADVLQQEVALPFTLVSGRIHELLIQVPWTKIMSEPIVVTIDTIECVLSLNRPTTGDDGPPPDSPTRKTQVVEAPPGYMQALVRRIVSNIAVRVHHLIVKYVQDDIVLSLNVKHLAVDSAGSNWEPYFADIEQAQPTIRRLVRLDDLTLCLDRADADGKIRFYQEPLLYRCQLDLRVLTRLVSANTRRASSLIVQLRSSKLAWGVTSDQLTLLLRLYRERHAIGIKPPTPSPKDPNTGGYSTETAQATHSASANCAEVGRTASWSDWAWSWMPAWADDAGRAGEEPAPPAALPVHFAAYFDEVSLLFKVMEMENGARKRSRAVLQLNATHAALKTYMCSPVSLQIRFGTRRFTVLSNGKCVCGHVDYNAQTHGEPTVFLQKLETEPSVEKWVWPDEHLDGVEIAPDLLTVGEAAPRSSLTNAQKNNEILTESSEPQQPDPGQPEEPAPEVPAQEDDREGFWQKLAPLIYLEFRHERAPPDNYTNPYDSPPSYFQYSDWVEECDLKIILEPIELRVCMGLLHRVSTLVSIYQELPAVPVPDILRRPLTVEECEILSENLPQRRISIETRGLRVRIIPWDHSLFERPTPPPLLLDLEFPKSSVVLNYPLYPYRVCSAACQMPMDSGPLWQGARLHCTVTITAVRAGLGSPSNTHAKTCARADIRAVAHYLLHKDFFTTRESVKFSYSLKITEANICGSYARLQAACAVPSSLAAGRAPAALRYTTLPGDALADDESVAIDLAFEDFVLRGYVTRNTQTHIMTLQSAKVTALHEPKGEPLKQSWVFSAPDAPTTTPYLRFALQWCDQPLPTSLDYIGIWTEPTALCVDPLFIAWLAYKPMSKPLESMSQPSSKHVSLTSTQLYMRRRVTPPSSSGRGASKLSAELVHLRPHSVGSSEKAETRDKQTTHQPTPVEQWWQGDHLLVLHQRLRQMLVNVELGLTLLYVTLSSASAVDCGTVRDAMERHAIDSQRVLVLSLGRVSMFSGTTTRHFWNKIKNDGPTFITPNPNQASTSQQDSFPWKMRLADVSCYTLEVRADTDRFGREKPVTALRSSLKTPLVATPRTVLALVTTTVTLSVVTKAMQIITAPKRGKTKSSDPHDEAAKIRYFKTGLDFKPTTLKEFIRGPAKRQKVKDVPEIPKPVPTAPPTMSGPIVSVGVHLHADTPPIMVRLEHDQVCIVAGAVHCFTHIVALLHGPPPFSTDSYTTPGGARRTFARSASDTEDLRSPSDDSTSENRSELISIFEAHSARDTTFNIKTFFWFQWVISRATLVAATDQVKLVFDVDDIIATVDVQEHYNQLKIKLASASVRHYEKSGSDDWTAGVLGGRVLEVREPTNSKEDNHFLSVIITQALISKLPASWKEELDPKMLEHKPNVDSMWEIYVTLAPLEMVLQPKIMEQIVSLVQEMAPQSFCPLQKESTQKLSTWQWPFCYVTAGGLRLLLAHEQESKLTDDTFIFAIGKATVSPHPENPICRRSINTGNETGWLTAAGGMEGRQYELLVKHVGIRTAKFRQLVNQESSEAQTKRGGTSGENPALKWTQPTYSPNITPVLHSVDVGCVLAPALYVADMLACGPAVELNLVSDCDIELSLDQLVLAKEVMSDVYSVFTESEGILFDEEKHGVCPYATLLMNRKQELLECVSEISLNEGNGKTGSDLGRDCIDSGVDTTTFSMKQTYFEENSIPVGLKKCLSIGFAEDIADPSEYLEVFITMGVIELSLYTVDDGTPDFLRLRPPAEWTDNAPETSQQQETSAEGSDKESDRSARDEDTPPGSRSLTETIRMNDAGRTKLKLPTMFSHAWFEGNLPLIHVTLSQPNLYYWRKKTQKTLQVSLFNAWVGLGAGQIPGHWHAPLLSTARGASDPRTDIPPALATMKVVVPSIGSSVSNAAPRGSARIDVERPVLLEVCTDRLRRLKQISTLIKSKTSRVKGDSADSATTYVPAPPPPPPLYRLRQQLMVQSLESATLATCQVCVRSAEGAAGWDSLSLQVGAGSRPDRLFARALLTAAVVSVGPPSDARHVLLKPMMLGMELEATWEAWRRAENGLSASEPMVRACMEADRASIDVRPADLAALTRLRNALRSVSTDDDAASPTPTATATCDLRPSMLSADAPDDHFYKDDLRSGAFKMMAEDVPPMAYQVTLHNNAVSWRYPHPRAITRLVAYPLPDREEETCCVLELFNPLLGRWEEHSHFAIPAGEPVETNFYVSAPDAVFAVMWRYRAFDSDEPPPPFEFTATKFLPKSDPLTYEPPFEPPLPKPVSGVTAEQLSGVVQVDSFFSPRLTPCVCLAARLANLMIHVHNDLPPVSSHTTSLEGYYVSKPLMRSHRVLTLTARDASAHAALASPAGALLLLHTNLSHRVLTLAARDASAHAALASPAGALLLLHTNLSSDILDCATGTMEQLIDEFRLQGGISLPTGSMMRSRVALSRVHAALHVPRLRTLHALALDWRSPVSKFKRHSAQDINRPTEVVEHKRELADVTAAALEGRVSLWIHNGCACALRVGQEGTDEVVPLGAGTTLAYRWRSPSAAKLLRFSLAGPSADWHWSSSIPFTAGTGRVRLSDAEALFSKHSPGGGVFLYTRLDEQGARRTLHLAGRLCPANMLRSNLLFKVRIRSENQWRTVCAGEMLAESIGNSIICEADCEMALKIKFVSKETGWSGDIPLKECPKENVPWLVKVPSEGQSPFTSVWCRVVRARSDGRVLVAVWPLYVLFSHLPLDTDVFISTDAGASPDDVTGLPPAVVQATPGRGACTHLHAPGTTAARHSLSFQYRHLEAPVIGEVIPLHYGVTESSVFEKRAPVASLEAVIAEAAHWLERAARGADTAWPHSIVAKHWPWRWSPAMLQPRCDVTVRYEAVHVGGGCSLEVQLSPVVLLCNAAPVALTLRAHDAAPLCKLEPGTAVSASSAILKKPFFISVEIGRETFVSSELAVSGAELGRYGTPPRGLLALDHTVDLAVQCNQKVALLTMYYEIKEEINVLGISCTYMLVNRMKTGILVSAIAVPNEIDDDYELRPSMYKAVEPTPEGSIHGTPVCRFHLMRRWRDSDPGALRLYLCVTLRSAGGGTAPLRLAHSPLRRSLALFNDNNRSVPVVITQMKHEGRWLVTVSEDPCPQLVVHNNTKTALSVAQPAHQGDEPSTSKVMVSPECAGTRWVCTVAPDARTHYTTPGHCARYPPPAAEASPAHTMTFLTFAKPREEGELDWCTPVALTDGEQLLQLSGGVTVKLRVRIHPHSTLLELRDVDQNDISASDIRRRLGRFSSEILVETLADDKVVSQPPDKEGFGAEEKRFRSPPRNPYSFAISVTASGVGETTELVVLVTSSRSPSEPVGSAAAPELAAPTAATKKAALPELVAGADTDNVPVLPSTVLLYTDDSRNNNDQPSRRILRKGSEDSAAESVLQDVSDPEWDETASWAACDRLRLVASEVAVELAAAPDSRPLIALHLDRAALLVRADSRRTKTTLFVSDVQIDNLQYESGQFDFAVVATTMGQVPPPAPWPPLWNPFDAEAVFSTRQELARALLKLTHDTWTVDTHTYTELSEIEVRVGPLALYVEDAYVSALAALARMVAPAPAPGPPRGEAAAREEAATRAPLRLRLLHVHPLDLMLTLHTAVRMYIALDQSPLRLSTFKLHDVMTSSERLSHALTIHYLSAAILGAGWVVGGLELLGAPGALAARVGGATGGVRGIASTAAAALLRSLSAWAGSLARNLDLLAGDEEHARRAAAARRRPPSSFIAGLAAGITNFAINILGAVGGLAHHPLVGVAVGETESSATALRRGLIGAFAKPLSATADLVAFAGNGLLTQTGWDPVPQPRSTWAAGWCGEAGWRRDCVRWSFRLGALDALAGFQVLLDEAPLLVLLTHKFLVVVDHDSERIVEMIDFRFCSLGPLQGQIIELSVTQNRQAKVIETRGDQDDEMSAAAMARVARYTGAEASGGGEARVLSLLTAPGCAPALLAALQAAIHHNSTDHFPLL